ncbi:MAG: hypothetical protein ACR2L6_09600 [Gemmatimonadaceae bacterium]
MLEPRSLPHPADDALQRLADGDVDRDGDASLVAHVDHCPQCRDEIERVRRVTAALSLSSVAPDAVLGKIRQRRAQGSMQPPVRGSSVRSSRRMRFVLPAGLAAAAIFALFGKSAWRPDSTPAVHSKAAGHPTATLSLTIDDWRQPALDSVLAALRDRDATVRIFFSPLKSKASLSGSDLADSVAGYFRDRGISAERVTLIRRATGPDPRPGLVTITIVRGPSP